MITVTDNSDSGVGTLRQAIADAAVGEEIQFAIVGNIDLSSELVIAKNLTITGGGVITVDRDGGAGDLRIFNITAGTVLMSGLTISGGQLSGVDKGAGILIALGANVTLNDCTIDACVTASDGAGIYNNDTLALNRCTISNCTATGSGGGLFNNADAHLNNCNILGNTSNSAGGGIRNSGQLWLTSCTVGTAGSRNQCLTGTGVGGGLWTETTATVVDTVFDYNHAAGVVAENVMNNGTMYMLRGDVNFSQGPRPAFYNHGTLELEDVTIRGNVGIGLYNDTGSVYMARVTSLRNPVGGGDSSIKNNLGALYMDCCTVSDNLGAGIENALGSIDLRHSTVTQNGIGFSGQSGSAQSFENNIISGNTVSDVTADIIDTTSLGHNIYGTMSSPLTLGPSDLVIVGFANLKLGALANNGGSTLTHALLAGSPAIDAGNTAGGLPLPGGWGFPDPRFQNYTASPPVYDQRMAARVQGPAIDIGAYEFTQTVVPIPPNVVYPATQVLEDGCEFCGLDAGKLKAVQLQLAASTLLKVSPSADVTLSAVLQRSVSSGICCLTKDQLRAVILQLAYQIRSAFNG